MLGSRDCLSRLNSSAQGMGQPYGVPDPQTKHTALPGMKPPRRPGSIHPAKTSPQIYPGPARPLCTVARQIGADLACCRAGGRQESFFRTRCTLSRCSHLDTHTETDAGTTVYGNLCQRKMTCNIPCPLNMQPDSAVAIFPVMDQKSKENSGENA